MTVYPNNKEKTVLKVFGESVLPIMLTLDKCTENELSWEINSIDEYRFVIEGLNSDLKYKLNVQGKTIDLNVETDGCASFTYSCKGKARMKITGK